MALLAKGLHGVCLGLINILPGLGVFAVQGVSQGKDKVPNMEDAVPRSLGFRHIDLKSLVDGLFGGLYSLWRDLIGEMDVGVVVVQVCKFLMVGR